MALIIHYIKAHESELFESCISQIFLCYFLQGKMDDWIIANGLISVVSALRYKNYYE